MQIQTPSFESELDAKRFFISSTTTNDQGEEEEKTFPCKLIRATVVVTTAYGETVAFSKTNRGKTFLDSRGKKKKMVIEPCRISESEVKSELRRLLDNDTLADEAFAIINV